MCDEKVPCENCICIAACRSRYLLSEIIERCEIIRDYINGSKNSKNNNRFFIVIKENITMHHSCDLDIHIYPDSQEVWERIKIVFFALNLEGKFEKMSSSEIEVFINDEEKDPM